jgi:hypothetical protein
MWDAGRVGLLTDPLEPVSRAYYSALQVEL